jgi:hypothetical protein
MTGLQPSFVACLALALSACASVKDSGNLAAQAAHYGVSQKLLRAAENHGYWPRIRQHQTVFCRSSEVTGSYIEGQECLDPAHLQTRLANEADEQLRDQQALERNRGACAPNAAGC